MKKSVSTAADNRDIVLESCSDETKCRTVNGEAEFVFLLLLLSSQTR